MADPILDTDNARHIREVICEQDPILWMDSLVISLVLGNNEEGYEVIRLSLLRYTVNIWISNLIVKKRVKK